MNTKRDQGKNQEQTLYQKLLTYRASPYQLDRNGFPRPDPVNKDKATFSSLSGFTASVGDFKKCFRCEKFFSLSKVIDGTAKERCFYHKRRIYPGKPYLCCGGRPGSLGCGSADSHVHRDNMKDLTNYLKTAKKSEPASANPGIFALDSEMSYTVVGWELTRISIVDHNRTVVFDSFVKPEGKVLDYNTEFSGVTKNDIEKTNITLKDVQKFCMENFSADTILIGHGLDSELILLRLIHETVVDTSLVFPHPRGPPHKKGLSTLSSNLLGRNIQSGNHSSKEDALACMDIMLQKARREIGRYSFNQSFY